ncbi:MAG: SUMF1/EgtB/PvdO family nonheme iron enzyme [Polyangiaceae bacterium]
MPVKEAPSACPAGMQRIEGGTLDTLERGRDVAISSFCIDEHEVTVAEFRACVASGKCARECAPGAACPEVPARTDWDNPEEDARVSQFCNGAAKDDRGQHPVNCVSFGEAESFCAAQEKRLPTGDEWEWAARGARVPSPWGSPVAKDEICWGKPKKRAGTCAVETFEKDKTAAGVRDLGGNVSEWVRPPQRSKHPAAVWAYGASWYAIDDGYARAALGGVQMPARRAETVGFRCAAAVGRG